MEKFMRKINTSPKPKPKFSPSRSKVFGVPLKLLLNSKSTGCIPEIVSNLCHCLLKHGTEVEGIFRINGSARLIELFKRDLEFSPNTDLHPTENVEIYALAGVLKLFLRELPGGVVPEEYTLKLIKTIKGDEEDAFECLEKLQEMIPSLPRENRRLLHYLCRFLNRIAANEPVNKMSCQGLGILFGPCVFRFDVRSQGLRNQGLVNQAMTVLIQHCDAIFSVDRLDETFALGDDLVDSWRSAASNVDADPLDLKVFSSATSCSASSGSRSFYTTLFSGRSHERLTTEGSNHLLGTDLPSVVGSRQPYKLGTSMVPVPGRSLPQSRLTNTDPFKTEPSLAPQTASGRIRVTDSRPYESEHHTLTLSSVSVASTSSGSSSSSSSSNRLNTHPAESTNRNFVRSGMRISHSESCSNLPDDINFHDSSNQLALDLAHLLTSFGTANSLDFPSLTVPDDHSAMLARHLEEHSSRTATSEQNGLQSGSAAFMTGQNSRSGSSIRTPRDALTSKPPLIVVPRTSTCGDHESQMPCLYTSDYEVCMYELPTFPDSCLSNTTVTTTAPSMTTGLTKELTDPRTDDLSDLDFLRKVDANSESRPTRISTPYRISSSCPAGERLSPHPTSVDHLNQAISACLDAHLFPTSGSVKDPKQSPSASRKTDTRLPTSLKGMRTSAFHSSFNAYSTSMQLSPPESSSSFPDLPARCAVSRDRLSCSQLALQTANSVVRGTSENHPFSWVPHNPSDTAERISRPVALATLTSMSAPVTRSPSQQYRLKNQVPSAHRPFHTRSISSPLVYLSGVIQKPSWLGTHRKQLSKRSTNGNTTTPIVRTQSNPTNKVGFRDRSPVSNSAPPSPNPTCPVHPISGLIKATPVLLSSSCSQLPRDQDRKQPDFRRISAKPDVCARSEMKTHYGTQQTRYFPVTRAHSFHGLPPPTKPSQSAVLSKSASVACLRDKERGGIGRADYFHTNRPKPRHPHSHRQSEQEKHRVNRSHDSSSVHTSIAIEPQITHASSTASGTESGKHQADRTMPPTNCEESTAMECVGLPTSLQSFCDLLTAVLAEQRRCCNRPSNLDEMTSEQIFQEKVDLQKGLLYFERLHGRPTGTDAKRIMKPLYERYRQVKRMLRAEMARSVLTSTSGVKNPIDSSKVHPPKPKSNDRLPPKTQTATIGAVEPIISYAPGGNSASVIQATCSGSVVERENSRLSATSDYRLYDSVVSSLPASPKGEPEPCSSTAAPPSTPLTRSLGVEVDVPSGPQGEHMDSRYHLTITREDLLLEWRHIFEKKRALQHELRDFEMSIEQVKGRPPNKVDRRPMRDKYHEYRSLKRTLESLALRLNMEPMIGIDPANSAQSGRGSQRHPDSDMKTHTPTSAIRTP